jgi:glycosyltransferase involved in cell wall biosynthesis
MANLTPSVTVGICAFNASQHIDAALQSIFSQTYKNIRITIVNDGSHDETLKFAQSSARQSPYPVTIFTNPKNLGVGLSRERIRADTDTDFLVWLDADDRYKSDRIEKLIYAQVASGADLQIDTYEFKKFGQPFRISGPPDYLKSDQFYTRLIERNGMLPHPLISRNCYKNLAFDDFRYSEDYDYWVKATFADMKFSHVDHVGYEYNDLPTSLSKSHDLGKRSVQKILTSIGLDKIINLYQKRGYTKEVIAYALSPICSLMHKWDSLLEFSLQEWYEDVDPQRYFYSAIAFFYLRKFDDAYKFFCLSNELMPNEPAVFNNLGVIHRLRGNENLSFECFQKALELLPTYHDSLQNLSDDQSMLLTTTPIFSSPWVIS